MAAYLQPGAQGSSQGGINDYRYKPLTRDYLALRTLRLEPSDFWSSDICCHLQDHYLDPKLPVPSFEALSYTWDGGVENAPILLDGRRRLVTANLESFLRHRRESKHPVDIWVDAVCINQNDLEEKSSQIKCMNLIYMTAARVVVWLGKADDDSDTAMEELSYLGSGSPYNKMNIITGSVLVALENLLRRKWWSRIWIVQEIFWGGCGMKLDKMRILCGNKELMWTTLVIAAARMQSHKDDQRQYFPTIRNIFILENMRYQCGDMIDSPPDEGLVFDLIAQHRHFEATEPQDKIYALLGLVLEKHCPPFSKVNVDCSVSVQETYKSFALMALRSPVGLKVLRHCHPRLIESLPSWVPDWSTCSAERALPHSREAKHVIEPWWMNPTPIMNDSASGVNGISYKYRVPLSSKTPPGETGTPRHLLHGMMLNTIPRIFYKEMPQETIDIVQTLIREGNLVLISEEDDVEGCAFTKRESNGEVSPEEVKKLEKLSLLAKSERVTRFRSQSKIVSSKIAAVTGYRAAGDTSSNIEIDELRNTLIVEGILYDKIDTLQDPFVDEVAANWENAIKFMVAIGGCKRVAVADYTGRNPYLTEQSRTEAFWLSLFAGQTTVPGHFGEPIDIKDEMQFQDWLPPIPSDWKAGTPPVTVVNSGRLESAQCSATLIPTAEELVEYFDCDSGGEVRLTMPGTNMSTSLQPLEWTDDDHKYYAERFQTLGKL